MGEQKCTEGSQASLRQYTSDRVWTTAIKGGPAKLRESRLVEDDMQYRRVSFDKIIRGAHGYSKEEEFESLPKQVEPLSRRQARTTVEKLERRGFFVRVPMNKRHTAYSRQHGIEKLVEMVAKRVEEKRTPSMDERLAMVEASLAASVAEPDRPNG